MQFSKKNKKTIKNRINISKRNKVNVNINKISTLPLDHKFIGGQNKLDLIKPDCVMSFVIQIKQVKQLESQDAFNLQLYFDLSLS